MVLMKSWCYYSCDEIKGNNQKGEGLWEKVMEMYEQYRRENPDKIGERNLDSMKGRHQRICKNVNSWVACYRKAYARKSSGMGMSDVKKDAHAQYTQVNRSNFNDMAVFEEVMSKLKKWEVPTGMDMGGNQYVEEGDDIIQESEGSTKRSKTNEDGDYVIPTNPDTPTSVPTSILKEGMLLRRKGGKQKVTEFSHNSEFTEEYRAMRMIREKELELSERQVQEMARLTKEGHEAEKHKSYAAILNTLLAKTHLTPAQEAMIEDLTEKKNMIYNSTKSITYIFLSTKNMSDSENETNLNDYNTISFDQRMRDFYERYYERNREEGHIRLFKDYFHDNPVYPDHIFRHRFRMRKPLFLRIVEAVTASDTFFQPGPNGSGREGHSALQKCTAAIRVLAYGSACDAVDEYLRMSTAQTSKYITKFVDSVITQFGNQYLRRPNGQDVARLLHVGEERGFPGMMGSIDCMHWQWKNCPTAWQGQYAGRSGKATIILEAVASYDLWIWHAFFGTPSSLNDINVLHRSPVFDDIFEGRALKVNYYVNGNQYNMGYYLSDGIYPAWASFVKSIRTSVLQKHKLFAHHQEAVRKDVERAFGVLQARFAFIKKPSLVWDPNLMGKIIMACIIMHNMIVEDERDTYLNQYDSTDFDGEDLDDDNSQPSTYSTQRIASLSTYMNNQSRLQNRETHNALKRDLIEHIWQKFGSCD
ncbi:uncharacterized protein LOC141620807 [Silene latifolia]|uniref:uncharacterized protein LOC141620807 n=1 Tax=Silene latifolia TaxID=37657 RepID=UPI003D789F3B